MAEEAKDMIVDIEVDEEDTTDVDDIRSKIIPDDLSKASRYNKDRNLGRTVEEIEEALKDTAPDPYLGKDTKDTIYCRICGKPFKCITGNHLIKHNISMREYARRYPSAPLNFFGHRYPRLDILPDTQFNKDTKKNKVKEQNIIDKAVKIMNFNKEDYGLDDIESVEQYLKTNVVGWHGEEVFEFLAKVVMYDPTEDAKKGKNILYKPNDQLRAADMLLSYTLGKPKQRQEKTVKTLNVTIGGTLPGGIDIGDLE